MRSEISQSRASISSLQREIQTQEAHIEANEATIATKAAELEVNLRTLNENSSIMSGKTEELAKLREHLAIKQQVSNAHNNKTMPILITFIEWFLVDMQYIHVTNS